MKRLLKQALVAGLLAMPLTAAAGVADNYPVPASNAKGYRGATVPYTRYDCNKETDATLGGGASIKTSPDWNPANTATQASRQAYVDLPVGGSVTWTMHTYGDGVTVRYTIKDTQKTSGKANGYAEKEGELEFYLNGELAGSVPLNSYHMWQYFSFGAGNTISQTGGDAGCFAFDERHTRLNKMAKPGDTIEVRCTSGAEVGVDFIETEVVPEALDPSDDANGRQIFNVTAYGASTSSANNIPAFNKAVAEASKVGGIVFIPEGTWKLSSIWYMTAKNVKIMGAGIWYTNLQFTNYNSFGGGVSGGNPSNAPSNTMDNVEFCHMYLNSNLADRYSQMAVYKCFMDIWCDGSAIHDIWEEHFECGFWFGDYNSATRRTSDGVKVFNNRIRNNLADGVNFCQGTSEAAVFNCNVRNNGDDGLACWNNDEGVKDEEHNTFCYNTIELGWRAGLMAFYGGKGHKAYNNYFADSFMAAGLHLNTTFPGKKYNNASASDPLIVENNYFVRCGTPKEAWGEQLAAIDVKEDVKHVQFKNNYIWDSPSHAIRLHNGSAMSFDGLYINGAGLSKQTISYGCNPHNPAAGWLEKPGLATFSDVKLQQGSIPAASQGMNTGYDGGKWPWWMNVPENWSWTEDLPDPAPYPDSEGIIPDEDPLETLTGYDVVMTGIDWLTSQDKHSMYEGDKVSFRVRIDNTGSNSIPAGAKFAVALSIDGASTMSYTVKEGLTAGGSLIIEYASPWTATLGKHEVKVTVDPAGKLLHESDKSNNIRVKNINVNKPEEGEEPEITVEPSGETTDLGVLKVWFEKADGSSMEEVKVGDKLIPHALIANHGTRALSIGPSKGVLWALDMTPEFATGMLWCDKAYTIEPGSYVDVVPNGGNPGPNGWNSDYTYTVKAEDHELVCRLDNPGNLPDTNAANNSLSESYSFPIVKPEYNPNPDKADNLDNGGFWDYEDQGTQAGFDLTPLGIFWEPGNETINAGEELREFAVFVKNESNVAVPSGKNVRVTLTIDGATVGTASYGNGIAAMQGVEISIPVESYIAPAGGHTVKVAVTGLSGELRTDNNTRERTFNAQGDTETPQEPAHYAEFTQAQMGSNYPFWVKKVEWFKDGDEAANIKGGDKVRFRATIEKVGQCNDAGKIKGIRFEFPAGSEQLVWADQFSDALEVGQEFTVTTNGGNIDGRDGTWNAVEGENNVGFWFDDQNRFGIGQGPRVAFPLKIGAEGVSTPDYFDEPTGADNRSDVVAVEEIETEASGVEVWYTLQGVRVERPTSAGIYICNGRKVIVK